MMDFDDEITVDGFGDDVDVKHLSLGHLITVYKEISFMAAPTV